VDHEQSVVLELDRHHLQCDSLFVVAEKDEPWAGALRRTSRRILLEAKAAMVDDVAGAFTRYPVRSRRPSLPCLTMEPIQPASKPSNDAAAKAAAIRVSRLREDAQRPISVNLAETIALSHALMKMADAARRQ
jgi:hypothetical protein